MPITESYLTTGKNVPQIFEAMKQAQAPEKFTIKFLYDLGFTSIADRPFIAMLKALNFLDESGVPKQRYFDFLDEEKSKTMIAQGVREAYSDLFTLNQKANEFTAEQVKNKLKSLLQGKKGDAVLTKMATTFVTLCSLGDFKSKSKNVETPIENPPDEAKPPQFDKPVLEGQDISLKYSINIELPATRDKLIYDAIFKSIRENLL
jgi:hypothetical protein